MPNDLHVTVIINPKEAITGTVRVLPLSNGQQATITIPADAYDGQLLWFPGYIKESEKDMHPGALILTVQIRASEEVTANDEDIVHTTSKPSQPVESSQKTPSPSLLGQSLSAFAPLSHTPVSSGKRTALNKVVMLALAALFITIGSGGAFLFTHLAQGAQVGTNAIDPGATATSQAIDATATSIVSGSATANVSTATAQAQGTATTVAANPNPYAGGTLSYYDKLDGSSKASSDWTAAKGCTISNGALHALDNDPTHLTACSTQASTNISQNFTVEVNANILSGDTAQIYFRAGGIGGTGYFFLIDANGRYQLLREGESSMLDTKYTTLLSGSSAAIRQGYNQSNTMAVVAQGSTFTVYVNGQKIGSCTDSNFSNGFIGLVAADYSNGSKTTEVAFSNLRVWNM